MRRAELSREAMEVQHKNLLQAHLANSVFAQKLLGIPMFKAAVDTAGGAYVKVKDSNALVGKSIELALNISSAFVDKLAPIAEKGINVASPITMRVDEIAAKSLDGLIARVPVINDAPQEIVQNTRSAIEKRVTVINGYTEAALKTWPVQSAMDVYEALLSTACTTLDNVLPPSKEEKSSESEQNGHASTKESLPEEEKHKRGIMLAQRTYLMFTSAFRRVFGKCQTQVENAVNATDLVVKQVRNAVGDVTNANSDANNVANNGDINNKSSANKKNKNKNKNAQEQ